MHIFYTEEVMGMQLNLYQSTIIVDDKYQYIPDSVLDPAFVTKIFGLTSEASEVSEKCGLVILNYNGMLNPYQIREITKELGDTLWYTATVANYIGFTLGEIAHMHKKAKYRIDSADDYENLTFNGFQDFVLSHRQSKQASLLNLDWVAYIMLLCGESGKVSGKFHKIIRDRDGHVYTNDYTDVAQSLGLILEYLSLIADALGLPFSCIAEMNLYKLEDRKKRYAIYSTGDNR